MVGAPTVCSSEWVSEYCQPFSNSAGTLEFDSLNSCTMHEWMWWIQMSMGGCGRFSVRAQFPMFALGCNFDQPSSSATRALPRSLIPKYAFEHGDLDWFRFRMIGCGKLAVSSHSALISAAEATCEVRWKTLHFKTSNSKTCAKFQSAVSRVLTYLTTHTYM